MRVLARIFWHAPSWLRALPALLGWQPAKWMWLDHPPTYRWDHFDNPFARGGIWRKRWGTSPGRWEMG